MPNLQEPKSRWQESEWWLTILTILLGILLKLGILNVGQTELIREVANDIISLILIIAPVIGWQFIRTRKKIEERDQDVRLESICQGTKPKIDPPQIL